MLGCFLRDRGREQIKAEGEKVAGLGFVLADMPSCLVEESILEGFADLGMKGLEFGAFFVVSEHLGRALRELNGAGVEGGGNRPGIPDHLLRSRHRPPTRSHTRTRRRDARRPPGG